MAQRVHPSELHRVVGTCLIYRLRGRIPEFLIKQRDERQPFPNRWEAGSGGGLSREELDSVPFGPDGQQDIVEHIVRVEARDETGLEIGELWYLGSFRFVRLDGIPVMGMRYFAQATSEHVVLGDGARNPLWITADEAPAYNLIGSALEDMQKVTTMLEVLESEEVA